jgi:hypothetical protein
LSREAARPPAAFRLTSLQWTLAAKIGKIRDRALP